MLNKKIIQVPVEIELLYSLDRLSARQGKARAELIREACKMYLTKIENEEKDKQYIRGYRKIPEDSAMSDAQAAVAGQVLAPEEW